MAVPPAGGVGGRDDGQPVTGGVRGHARAAARRVPQVLTGSPFGFELLAGQLPLFDPYGWDPDRGLDDAIHLRGWTCRRQGADDAEQALAMLQDAVTVGPVLAGPVEIGLLRHQPGMTGPIESDHFVTVLEIDDELVRFHDPHGFPYATLPIPDFLSAWRAETIAYRTTSHTMRSAFHRARQATVDAALRAALPGAVAWCPAAAPSAVPTQSADLRHDQAAAIATRQARLVGSLQHDIVAGHTKSAAKTLRQLASTYDELAAAIS